MLVVSRRARGGGAHICAVLSDPEAGRQEVRHIQRGARESRRREVKKSSVSPNLTSDLHRSVGLMVSLLCGFAICIRASLSQYWTPQTHFSFTAGGGHPESIDKGGKRQLDVPGQLSCL